MYSIFSDLLHKTIGTNHQHDQTYIPDNTHNNQTECTYVTCHLFHILTQKNHTAYIIDRLMWKTTTTQPYLVTIACTFTEKVTNNTFSNNPHLFKQLVTPCCKNIPRTKAAQKKPSLSI